MGVDNVSFHSKIFRAKGDASYKPLNGYNVDIKWPKSISGGSGTIDFATGTTFTLVPPPIE